MDTSMPVESGDNRDEENMDKKSQDEMTDHIQNVFQEMRNKFETLTDQTLSTNGMGDIISRIDNLEKNISDFMNNAGFETPDK